LVGFFFVPDLRYGTRSTTSRGSVGDLTRFFDLVALIPPKEMTLVFR